ncbi:MAG: formylglycine-generating enzyme family protein [Panacagrimonas sp.]
MLLLAGVCVLHVPAQARTQKPAAKASCRAPQQTPTQQRFEVFRDCADTPEMVRLPGGRSLMGELGDSGLSYQRPIHQVEVPAFAIGRYEVTFLEWDECRAARFCQKSPDDEGWGRGFRPVINVSWLDAQQFVAWLSNKTGQRYRLPSEAEWEYAARAGTTTQFYWGDGAQTTCDYANTFDIAGRGERSNWFWSIHCLDGYAYTSPVGSFPPNPWGLFDMHGNVWEWVQDCWHSDYTGAPADGSPWVGGTNSDCGKRVNRGGGWGNHPRTMRAAKRDADAATGSGDAFGFRVVREERAQPPAAPATRTPQSAAP